MITASYTLQHVAPPPSRFLEDAWEGLSEPQKRLPPKYLYDKAGSELFEAICDVEEYYPTRTEVKILESHVHALCELISRDTLVVEYGSGASRKIRALLSATSAITGYMPIDISREALEKAASELKRTWPHLTIHAVNADYMTLESLPDLGGRSYQHRMVFFPGSTIGNLSHAEARDLLRRTRNFLGPSDFMLIGFDLVKRRDVLERAYNDSLGTTAAFNRNILERMNGELGADFDLEAFEHRAIYNEECSRIEMHLVARRDLIVRIQGRSFLFRKGETIHTESSRKFTISAFRALAAEGGYSTKAVWTDEEGLFAVTLITPKAPSAWLAPS